MGESIPTNILNDILPDASQSLSPQTPLIPPPKKRFTCFADLTTEIRLDIYNFLFPSPQSVNIAPQKGRRRRKCNCGPKTCTYHPITLFINSESRAETFRHYRTFTRDRMKCGQRAGGDVIYYRPKKDALYVDWKKIKGTGQGEQYDWIRSLREHNPPEFLIDLRSLEVKHWECNEGMRRLLAQHGVRLLPLLTGLQTLKIFWVRWQMWDVVTAEMKAHEKEEERWSVEAMTAYFEELRMRDSGESGTLRTVPQVVPVVQTPREERHGRWH